MNKGQQHPSNQVYEAFIVNAFLELMQTKESSKITITEICDQAQISRRTYYRHFDKKEDIIECYATQMMQALTERLQEPFRCGDIYAFAGTFFAYFAECTKELQQITQNGYGDIIFTCYLKCLLPLGYMKPAEASVQSMIVNQTECSVAYTLGGLWSLLTYWMSHGCVQTPEELAEIVVSRRL